MKHTKVSKSKLWAIVASAVLIFGFIMSFKIVEETNKSMNYVCQMPFTGEYRVWTDGGLKGQWFGDVQKYHKTSQVSFDGITEVENGFVPDGANPAAAVTFSDRGKGFIIGSFRVVLPTDDQNMKKIQRDFGSEEALINNLVRPTLYKVVTSCGPLMTSLESVSETRTDLISYITDQLNNGVYKTIVIKDSAKNEITGEVELRTRAKLIADPNAPNGYKRQEVSPFSQYGISCGLVSITDIKYDKTTQEQIDAQKQANLAVITAKTQATKAMQDAITIEEKGKAEAAKAKWEQEKEKAVAVTQAEQEREVARLEAEKAAFEKQKIIAEGQAEAEANRLKVAAGLTPQERAEWEYKTKVGIAEALAKSTTSWVPTVMMGGGSNGSAMDAVGLKMMMDVVNSMSTNKK